MPPPPTATTDDDYGTMTMDLSYRIDDSTLNGHDVVITGAGATDSPFCCLYEMV
jgi:hypothetical protein